MTITIHTDKLKKGILFDNLVDPSNGRILDNSPLFIPWTANYSDINNLVTKIEKYEFGIDYDFGVRTIFGNTTFYWIARGSLNTNEKFRGITTTVGFNEPGHEGLVVTRENLISTLGRPSEERDNFQDYKKANEGYGPWNCWEIDSVKVILWGSDFRGSIWYKLDIQKQP